MILEALKEELFQLELERQQGSISPPSTKRQKPRWIRLYSERSRDRNRRPFRTSNSWHFATTANLRLQRGIFAARRIHMALLLQRGVAAATDRLPDVISPRTHAIIDYITVGAFFVMAAAFWRRNKKAAVGALLCGSAELGTVLLTDFPGGVAKTVDMPTHLRIDMGLGATAATLPDLMGFQNEPESKWLRAMGITITANAGLTNPETDGQPEQARTVCSLITAAGRRIKRLTLVPPYC